MRISFLPFIQKTPETPRLTQFSLKIQFFSQSKSLQHNLLRCNDGMQQLCETVRCKRKVISYKLNILKSINLLLFYNFLCLYVLFINPDAETQSVSVYLYLLVSSMNFCRSSCTCTQCQIFKVIQKNATFGLLEAHSPSLSFQV